MTTIEYNIVESLIDKSQYYTHNKMPTKVIDGKTYIGVKRKQNDKQILYVLKENVTYVK